MAKFYGYVGYAESVETSADVFEDRVTRRRYSGDVSSNRSRWANGSGVNDDMVLNNVISILADPYAYNHFSSIKFVEFGGACWKVTDVEVQRPRLILTIGGKYNGKTE